MFAGAMHCGAEAWDGVAEGEYEGSTELNFRTRLGLHGSQTLTVAPLL